MASSGTSRGSSHGGSRSGAGRKPKGPGIIMAKSMSITQPQIVVDKFLGLTRHPNFVKRLFEASIISQAYYQKHRNGKVAVSQEWPNLQKLVMSPLGQHYLKMLLDAEELPEPALQGVKDLAGESVLL